MSSRSCLVLLDLASCFEPAAGHEQVNTPTGLRPLRNVVHERILLLRADVERCAATPSELERSLTAELLEYMTPEPLPPFAG